MDKPMILYRGTLKSCNYHCSYCPFAKRPMGKRELEQDKTRWETFIGTYLAATDSHYRMDAASHESETTEFAAHTAAPLQAAACTPEVSHVPGHALMVVPYGEALIHSWYWKGLGQLSALPHIDAAGAQTNLSFSIRPSLDIYEQAGGDLAKLRLWATFHPEMITAEAFAGACRELLMAGVSLCAGAVGAPENLAQIRTLRQALPAEIYLWINRMDGMNREYTREEINAFLDIDPYFLRELVPVPAEPARCQKRLFVEGNGQARLCNISQIVAGQTWETALLSGHSSHCQDTFPPDHSFPENRLCRKKFCSCYLAYGGRDDFMNQILFGPYPLFRIPRRPKAVFLDIMGTLLPNRKKTNDPTGIATAQTQKHLPEEPPGAAVRIPSGQSPPEIPALTLAGLKALKREQIPVFFATTLPYEDAMTRCRAVRHLFSGGVFSGGAHLRLEQGDNAKEYFWYLPETFLEHMAELEIMKKRFRYRILLYQGNSCDWLYKITLLRPRQLPWKEQEASELAELLSINKDSSVRYFIEDCCLQIVSSKATKQQGVRILCQWLGISPEETAAAGDSEEDAGMIRLGIL